MLSELNDLFFQQANINFEYLVNNTELQKHSQTYCAVNLCEL